MFGFKDVHGVLHLGPASERVVVKNTGTTRASVQLDVRLITAPRTATGALVSGLFVQAYRSPVCDVAQQPLDTMNLATEVSVDVDTTVWTDTLAVTDIASPLFVQSQASLYSSPEIGELPKTPPPFTNSDLAVWSQRAWYANTRLPDSLLIQLLGVGGGGDPDLQATGLREGDTITITSPSFTTVVLTASSVTDPVAKTFKVVSSGTPDENVTETIKELADCINGILALGTTFDLVAYVTPGPFDVASQLSIQRNTVVETLSTGFSVGYDAPLLVCTVAAKVSGEQVVTTTTPHHFILGDIVRFQSATPFPPTKYDAEVTTVVSGTQVRVTPVGADVPTGYTRVRRRYEETVWNPDLSIAGGQTSTDDASPARLFFSDVQTYEAVPLLNYLNIGVNGRAIRRVVPQRDRLLVFKDEGTYAVFGDYPFAVQLVDDTAQIIAPDSVASVGSTVFALMDDGVAAITEGAIQPVSEVIDYTLMPYLSSTYRAQTSTAAFGVAFESQKLYALFMPQLQSDDYSTSDYGAKAYVYGMLGNAWTTWSFAELSETGLLCGRVDPVSDRAYYGTPASPETTFPSLVQERNTSTRFDYIDDFGDGPLPILSNVRWAASTMGSPFSTKQVREAHLHFRQAECDEVVLTIETDVVAGVGVIPVPVNAPAGDLLIGGYVKPKQFRMLVPQAQQRGTYFMLRFVSEEEGAYWALNGYSLVFETTSERTGTVR